jgi:N-acetylmuramoyl-L-alanine amidase
MTKKKHKLSIKRSLKTSTIYSPNFNSIKRKPSNIKFIIFHYTGMKKQSEALKKLTDMQSKVSSHYLIKNNGDIVKLVPDLYIAWHAGFSFWQNYKLLNKDSIGIEISNPGHEHGYKKFSEKQIKSILKLTKILLKKYKIKHQNILGHSDIAPSRKRDPGEKFPWQYLSKQKIGYWHNVDQRILLINRTIKTNDFEKKLFFQNIFKIGYYKKVPKNINISKLEYLKKLTEAFQRRFRQDLISGIVDKECLIISKNLVKKLY